MTSMVMPTAALIESSVRFAASSFEKGALRAWGLFAKGQVLPPKAPFSKELAGEA